MKLAFFREKCQVPWKISEFFVRTLLFATTWHTAALNSWHVFTVLLTYIPPHLVNPLASLLYYFAIDSFAPLVTPSVNCPWIWHIFKNSTVKSCIFSGELGWSLGISMAAQQGNCRQQTLLHSDNLTRHCSCLTSKLDRHLANTHTHTHTHNRFTDGLEYVRVHPVQQVPER